MKELLSYAVGLTGLVMTLIAASAILGKAKYGAMKPALLHNLRTSSNRAQVMCNNHAGTVLEALGAAIMAGALTYSREPAAVAAGTLPAYTAATAPLVKHWGEVWKRAKTGVALGGGGAVLAILTDTIGVWQLLIAAAAGIAALLVLLHHLDFERSVVLARAELLPEIDRMFVEGRYAYARAPEPEVQAYPQY